MSNYEERTCDNCVYKKSMYCPNSFECYVKKDKPHFMSRATLIAENAKLKAENKQLQTENAKLLKENEELNAGLPVEQYQAKIDHLLIRISAVRAEAINEFAEWVIDLIFSNSSIDESETKSRVEEPPEFFQDKIKIKAKELTEGEK